MSTIDPRSDRDWQTRTRLLLGNDKLELLREAHVLVIGLGGVGAYAAELICRAGVGRLTIVDGDVIDETNLNRQLAALRSTIGVPKAEIMAARLLDINPRLKLDARHEFIRDERTDELLDASSYDYVVDAIDSLSPKVNLLVKCVERRLPIVSSMGSGGKTDPTQIRIGDIEETYNCRLAKMIRKRLHRRGIHHGIKVVFSPEDVPDEAVFAYETEDEMTKSMVGTISYLPAMFGCCCASAVIRDLLDRAGRD